MARRHSTGLELLRAQREMFARLNLTATEGHKKLAEAGLADSKDLTGGGLSPKQTHGAFARGNWRKGVSGSTWSENGRRRNLTSRQMRIRNLAGSVPVSPINRQAGTLQDSFLLRERGADRSLQILDLGQSNPGGGIFTLMPGGTKFMVDRAFSKNIRERWRPRNLAFIKHYQSQQRR